MAKPNESPKIIDPGLMYTVNSIAQILQVSEKWVKTHLIYPRKCRFKKQGDVYLVLGRWLIEWIEVDHELPGKSDEDES